MKIMIIDDDPLHLSSLKTSLKVRNYECKGYLNPFSALEAFRLDQFRVVITTAKMLSISKGEVLNRIRALSPGSDVILINELNDMKYKPADEAAISATIRKPVIITELIHLLEKIERKAETQPNEP